MLRLAARGDHRACSGLVVIVYTVAGGSEAVNVTQKYQIGVIFCGMVAAFVVLLMKLPAGADAVRRADPGRRLRQARRRRLRDRCEPPLYLLVRLAGRLVPGAVLFRYRPVAGAALPFGGVVAREPARPDVQRRVQDPDAVLHPAAGRAGVRLLPVRAAAGLLQRGGLGSRAAPRHRWPIARPRATVPRGPRRESGARSSAGSTRGIPATSAASAVRPRPGPRGARRARRSAPRRRRR